MTWEPRANLAILRQRADLLASIRRFFSARGVLEVETPLVAAAGVTDPAIEPMLVEASVSATQPRFLQSSPEYAMKRLLAAHREPIFQICRAFRDGEAGSRHNPEFTLLEWYRPQFDHHQLMDEVLALLCACLGERTAQKYSYRQLFEKYLQLDPFTAPDEELQQAASRATDVDTMSGDRDLWLDLLMSHVLEPLLAPEGVCFIFDYPASQAALAQIVAADDVCVGQRFELYVDGIELANGYRELTDPAEQRLRFEQDNARRRQRGQPQRPLDERLLAAMEQGLPACSGVALGVDRLLQLMCGKADMRDVLAFDWERA